MKKLIAVLLLLGLSGGAGAGVRAKKTRLKQGYVADRYGDKRITYEQVGPYAIVEGDIIVSPTDTMPSAEAVARRRFLWPGGVIPFVFAPGFTNTTAARNAMAAWTAEVPILRFVPRGTQADYLYFIDHPQANQGSSAVGRSGGKQDILIGSTLSLGATMHELGHAAGLEHEQSSPERDLFIRINTDNILPGKEHNFEKLSSTAVAILRPYDYTSIMHYSPTAFAKPGTVTMSRRDGGTTLGRIGAILTDSDVAAIRALYGPFAWLSHASGGYPLDQKYCHEAAPGLPGFFPGGAVFCEGFTNAWLWSHIGPDDPKIKGLEYRCNEIYEPLDPVFSSKKHHICMPGRTPYIWVWSDKGAIAGMHCILLYHREGGAPWADNFFCYYSGTP